MHKSKSWSHEVHVLRERERDSTYSENVNLVTHGDLFMFTCHASVTHACHDKWLKLSLSW